MLGKTSVVVYGLMKKRKCIHQLRLDPAAGFGQALRHLQEEEAQVACC
jgi:hypothetical protein